MICYFPPIETIVFRADFFFPGVFSKSKVCEVSDPKERSQERSRPCGEVDGEDGEDGEASQDTQVDSEAERVNDIESEHRPDVDDVEKTQVYDDGVGSEDFNHQFQDKSTESAADGGNSDAVICDTQDMAPVPEVGSENLDEPNGDWA